MRIFEHPNIGFGWKCPICGTNEDKPVTLVPIHGTRKCKIMRAAQFHIDCLDPVWYQKENWIFIDTSRNEQDG